MSEIQYRYFFTVRQTFGESPVLDCFYQLKTPFDLTKDQFEMWRTLKPGAYEDEVRNDSSTLNHIRLRLRFNTDMFKYVCLISSENELTRDILEQIITSKNASGELMEFLETSALKIF